MKTKTRYCQIEGILQSLEMTERSILPNDSGFEVSLRQSLTGSPERFNPHSYLKEQIKSIPYNTRREIKKSTFTVGDQIGSGNFSKVYKGEINGLYEKNSKTTVAIKLVNDSVNQEDLENLVSEIKIMSHVKPHLNLVSMIGSCTSEFKKHGKLWLLLEFCEYGDLRNYLLGNKWKILSGLENDPVNTRCLIRWAYDVANGMQYLAKK